MNQKTLGDMVVRIVGENAEFDASIDKSENKLNKFGDSAKKVGGTLTALITTPIIGLGVAAVKSAGQMQMYASSFETMLGSAGKAKVLMSDLQIMAAKTPFAFTDLAEASKTLLQFNVSADVLLPTLKRIGDVSQGNGPKFQSMSLAFGQIQATGRLMGQDLLQLINAGFNPLQEISRTTGQSIGFLKEEMQKGRISAQMISEAFKTATEQGGRFAGGMEAAAKTLPGLISTLGDDVATLGRSFGDILMPAVMDVVKELSAAAQWFTDLDIGTKKAILTVAGFAAALGPLVLAIGGVTKAVIALNAAWLANPIGLGIAAAALAAYGLVAAFEAIKASAPEVTVAERLVEAEQAMVAMQESSMDIKEQITEMAGATGLTRDRIIEVGLNSENLTEEYKTQLRTLRDQLAIIEAQEKETWGQIENAEVMNSFLAGLLNTYREIAGVQAKQAAENIRVAGVIEKRNLAEKKFNDDKARAENRFANGLITAKEFSDEILSINRELAEALVDIGYTIKDVDIGGLLLQRTMANIEQLTGGISGNLLEVNKAIQKLNNEFSGDAKLFGKKGGLGSEAVKESNIESVEDTRNAYLKMRGFGETNQVEVVKQINAIEAARRKTQDEATEKERLALEERKTFWRNYALDVSSLMLNLVSAMNASFIQGKQKEIEAIMKEGQVQEDLTAEEMDRNKRIAKLQYDIEKATWQNNLFMTLASGARAVVETFAKLGGTPAGWISAGLVAATTAVQIAAINKAKPVEPQLAEGAIVMPTPGGTRATIAEAGVPEIVGPIDAVTRMLQTANGGFNDIPVNFTIKLNEKALFANFFRMTKNRDILIDQGALV